MGAYCNFCGRRCFVIRVIPAGPQKGWTGCLATCDGGMAHDLKVTGHTHETAVNPVTDPGAADAITAELGEQGRKALALAIEAAGMAWFAGQVDAMFPPEKTPGVDRMTNADWAHVAAMLRQLPGSYPLVKSYWDAAGKELSGA